MHVNCWSKNCTPFQGTWVNQPPLFFSGVRITRTLVLCVCFVDRFLYFWYFSFDHCVVYPSSIFQFALPIWYLQTLHEKNMTETCSKNYEPIQYIDVTFLISILLSWLTNGFSTSVRLGGPLVEQDMVTLSVHLTLIDAFPVSKSLDFCVVLCRSLCLFLPMMFSNFSLISMFSDVKAIGTQISHKYNFLAIYTKLSKHFSLQF